MSSRLKYLDRLGAYGFDLRQYGAKGDGIADDTTAWEEAIEDICGSSNPATTTRTASAPLVVFGGRYNLVRPIAPMSVLGLEILGIGNPQIQVQANMSHVFDLNGIAYSRVGGFTVRGGAGVQVQHVIYSYWDATYSARSSTINRFHDIDIRNIDYETAIRVGKPLAGNQCDNHSFADISIVGGWTPGNTTRYQHGLYVGDDVYANNLAHSARKLTFGGNRRHVKVASSQLGIDGAGFDTAEVDLDLTATAYCSVSNMRSEDAARLLTTGGPTAYGSQISLRDIEWRGNALHEDGQWIQHRLGGVLRLDQVRCSSPTHAPVISASPTGKLRIIADALAIGGDSYTPATISECFDLNAQTSTDVRALVAMGAGGSVSDILST